MTTRIIACLTLLSFMAMSVACCSQDKQTTPTENSDNVPDTTFNYVDDDTAFALGYSTLSDRDLWLRATPSSANRKLIKRLTDAYNASVAMNSIITDFDMLLRFPNEDENVTKAIKSIDVTQVKDPEVVAQLKAYKKEMLYLLSVDPDSVNQDIHNPWIVTENLHAYLTKKYNVGTFGTFNKDAYQKRYKNCASVPDLMSLRKKRDSEHMIEPLREKYQNAKDFDARCIYLIELSYAYQSDYDAWIDTLSYDDTDNIPTIHIMESVMREKKYSKYLNELWLKWRKMKQFGRGASKDSSIPNCVYNEFRNMCASAILSHIAKHPHDIMAINEFLTLAYRENILREGGYFGNTSAGDDSPLEEEDGEE